MNVLVTGGCGYIGSLTVKELLSRGHKVTVIDDLSRSGLVHMDVLSRRRIIQEQKGGIWSPRDESGNPHWGGALVDVYIGRVTDVCEKVFPKDIRFDGCIHLAGYSHIGESVLNPDLYFGNNLSESISLLRFLRKQGTRAFVFGSSCSVYGGIDLHGGELLLREDDSCWPPSPYGISKRAFEMVLQSTANVDKDFSYMALRYFNVVGATEDHGVRWFSKDHPRILDSIFRRMNPDLFSLLMINGGGRSTIDGTAVRDFVHVSDVARANVMALELMLGSNCHWQEIINIASGLPTSIRQLLNQVLMTIGGEIEVAYVSPDPSDPDSAVADITKARKILGWEPRLSLQEMIISAWSWHRRTSI